MAGIKISALPSVVTPSLTDIMPEVQPAIGGITYKVSFTQLLDLFQANIQITESQVTNLLTDLDGKVSVSGDTMTGYLILNADPTLPLGAATKQYVDNIAAGLNILPATYAATTANLTAIYNNAAAGVGATLTNSGALAAFSVDGVSPPLGSRILVKNQTTTFQNGIYTLTTVGSGSIAWILTRSTDYDTTSDINPGDLVLVNNGTFNAHTAWVETVTVTTIGTDPILWSQFGAIGSGVNPGLINQVAYYATSGAVVSGLATANNGVLVTSGSGAPNISSTLPASLTIPQPKIDNIFDSINNKKVMGFSAASSAVNFIAALATASGSYPGFQFGGTDTDVGAVYVTKGVGNHGFYNQLGTSTGPLLQITGPLATVNGFVITSSATAGIPSISATGTDSTVNFSLIAKGGGFFLRDSNLTVGANLLWFNAAGTHFTNLKVAPAQATDATFTLPALDGSAGQALVTNGSGVLSFSSSPSTTAPKVTVYTSGSGTHTNTGSPLYLVVEMVGGGSGGQASSSNGNVTTAATNGGNTTFGSSFLVANGGTSNASLVYPGGLGGTASGGDINVTGGGGGGGSQNPTSGTGSTINQLAGGMGGSSYYGGAGASGTIGGGAGGAAAANSGSGGGGGGINLSLGYVTGAGGGSGGYCRKLILTPAASYTYAVGAAGAAGVGGISNGGAGSAGRIIVTEYYG